MERTKIGWFLFVLLRSLGIIEGNAVKIEYSMGDKRSLNGESLNYDNYRITFEKTVSLVKEFGTSSVYKELTSLLPEDKVALYFEKLIYNNILPLIRLFCIVQWHISNNNEHHDQHCIVWPANNFFAKLQRHLSSEKIFLAGYRSFSVLPGIRSFLKKLYNWFQDLFVNILSQSLRPFPNEKPCIAVHYTEGIDTKRRSDLFWYPGSMIDPGRVLIYFDRSHSHPITARHVKQIESMGMRWLSLAWRKDIPCGLGHIWRAPLKRSSSINIFKNKDRNISRFEKWLLKASCNLLRDVEYWQAFYRAFNIKIHLDAEEAGLQNVAQNIALDLVGGIRIGKQRSEWQSLISGLIGCYPDHVFFSWNLQSPIYLEKDKNYNNYCIISGFPYDSTFSENKHKNSYIRESLHDKGVTFIIALYDNMYGNNLHFSKNTMLSFYRNFLEWMIEDIKVGVIIKSKKPHILTGMTEISAILSTAQATGRCVIMNDVYGRLPSEVAFAADMAVGIGISSAVTEALISGCRGVYCDLTRNYSHPYYKIGYKKIIFDDIKELIEVMRRFKKEPQSVSFLGDFSGMLDMLDPFRDGQAGNRIGTYMRWFLEAIDAGEVRSTAVNLANKAYAQAWGKDSVILMSPLEDAFPKRETS